MADDDRTARIAKLEECMDGFDAMSDDPKVFAKYMETWKCPPGGLLKFMAPQLELLQYRYRYLGTAVATRSIYR